MFIYMFIYFLFIVMVVLFILLKAKKNTANNIAHYSFDQKFETIYSNILDEIDTNQLDELKTKALSENARKIKQFKFIFYITIIIFIVLLVLCFKNFVFIMITVAYSFVIIFAAIIMSYLSKKENNTQSDISIYKSKYKAIVIPTFLKQFDEKINYLPTQSINKQTYDEAEFEKYDTYYADDFMEVTLKNNYTIKTSDISTQYITKNDDGKDVYHNLFNGIFVVLETPKAFNDSLYLKKDKKYRYRSIEPYAEKVQLDSSEFEKYFDVYSTNNILAMQLLTADIMEFLIDFQKNTGISFELTIKNNKVYIRFYSGNIFVVPDLAESYLDKEKLSKYYYIINFTFKFTYMLIDLLNNTQY